MRDLAQRHYRDVYDYDESRFALVSNVPRAWQGPGEPIALEATRGPGIPRKIYLRRNSGTRRLLNSAEIERLLLDRGFSIIEPEHLTFIQQLSIFRWADVVIGDYRQSSRLLAWLFD